MHTFTQGDDSRELIHSVCSLHLMLENRGSWVESRENPVTRCTAWGLNPLHFRGYSGETGKKGFPFSSLSVSTRVVMSDGWSRSVSGRLIGSYV